MENKTNDIEEQLVDENSSKLLVDTYTNTKLTYMFLCRICVLASIFLFVIIYFSLR